MASFADLPGGKPLAAAPPPPPSEPPPPLDYTIGSNMWPDCVVNRDVAGYKLPKPASPCYLLLTKGNPNGAPLEQAEIRWFNSFVEGQIRRNPVGAPFLAKHAVWQTRPDTWYPEENARHLLIYYMPWRKHHHDSSVGGYANWSWHHSDKNTGMVCQGAGGGVASDLPTSQEPTLPTPKDEITLIKKGLDTYYFELRELGLTVDAPTVDADYLWTGFWEDDAVLDACGPELRHVSSCRWAWRSGLGVGRDGALIGVGTGLLQRDGTGWSGQDGKGRSATTKGWWPHRHVLRRAQLRQQGQEERCAVRLLPLERPSQRGHLRGR